MMNLSQKCLKSGGNFGYKEKIMERKMTSTFGIIIGGVILITSVNSQFGLFWTILATSLVLWTLWEIWTRKVSVREKYNAINSLLGDLSATGSKGIPDKVLEMRMLLDDILEIDENNKAIDSLEKKWWQFWR